MLISKEAPLGVSNLRDWAEESRALEATERIAADGKESGKWKPKSDTPDRPKSAVQPPSLKPTRVRGRKAEALWLIQGSWRDVKQKIQDNG